MKKNILIYLFLTAISISAFAQKKNFTMKEAVIGQWRELYPERISNIQWLNSNTVLFQDYTAVYTQGIKQKEKETLFDLAELNKALKSAKADTFRYVPYVKVQNNNELTLWYGNKFYCYSVSKKAITLQIELPKEASNQNLCFEKKAIAYTVKNNVFIAYNGKQIQVTNDKNPNIVNGESVSRNEFGINGGLFWSPKGNKLAFYRKDNSNVKDYPIVDIRTREAELSAIKYPMAGMKSEHVSLGVFNLDACKLVSFKNDKGVMQQKYVCKQNIFIEKDDTVSEKYLTNISWDLKGEKIYIQVLNREQNEMKMNRYNAETGVLEKTLFTETHKKYVEPQHKLLFVNNNEFIYQTRTYGYNHAYLYNTDGKQIKQLTKGDWEITHLIGTDGKNIYYMSTKESPIQRHAYRTNIKTGETQKLTSPNGVHSVVFNDKYSYLADSYSNTKTPRVVNILNAKGETVKNLLTAENPLTDYDIPEMTIGTIKSADGKTDLYYRLIKPTNFDPNKKYPAVVYVYGGPHAQLIHDTWLGGARMWQYLMAQKGYVMLTVDNRGSANRGLEFENVIHRQCGVNEMKDQMEGIKMLKGLPYVDAERIGVHGWSYGGFMTISLTVNYPETFKVACAGGPVIDWKYYEIMYGERYMDKLEENKEGYQFTSLIPRAKDLKSKLLIVQGAIDPTVVMQHSQLFVRECIKNNVPVDYFIYPRAEHNVRGYDRIHLMQKVTDYFEDYLK